MTAAATLCVREGDGTWHAIGSAGPDPQAFNDPIACGGVITLPGHKVRREPDCPDCLAAPDAWYRDSEKEAMS